MSRQPELIKKDIDIYLAQQEKKELLRLLTCGSVDDGKSTLIGRLLYDSKLIYEDQLATLAADSARLGSAGDTVDLALLVDGLQAEREQGITIDVAYRYFSTAKRKFIIADTPGHEQYTRNMATGASTCDLVIVLIDARSGAQTQTYRHSIIASLLGIRHGIIAINKMDLVDYSEAVYDRIKNDYLNFAAKLDYIDLQFIPISALHGDNMTSLSKNMRWYHGKSLMEALETTMPATEHNLTEMRFPVQYVNRPDPNFRGYCGTLAAGTIRPGDAVTILPSGKTSTIQTISTDKKEVAEAFFPMAITVTLNDKLDISRGDMIAHNDCLPLTGNRLSANIIWMSEQCMTVGTPYYFKFSGGKFIAGNIAEICHRIDVNTLAHATADTLRLNEIGYCRVALNTVTAFDPYRLCKGTGSFIIIDRLTNTTVGAGMVIGEEKAEQTHWTPVSNKERCTRYGQYGLTVWLTGKDSPQKARLLERKLFDTGRLCFFIEEGAAADADIILSQAGIICIRSMEKQASLSVEQGVVFDCETESIDRILSQIIEKTRLR